MNDAPPSIATLCPDDDALGKSLAEVDSSLAAWVSAVRRVQALLTEQCENNDVCIDAAFAHEPAPGTAATVAEPEAPAPAPALDEPGASVTADNDPQRASEAPDPAATEPDGQASPDPDTKSDEAKIEEQKLEQAFLASLDDETRILIQIRRRMSSGNKSARQLFAELEVERARQELEPRKRERWWRTKR